LQQKNTESQKDEISHLIFKLKIWASLDKCKIEFDKISKIWIGRPLGKLKSRKVLCKKKAACRLPKKLNINVEFY